MVLDIVVYVYVVCVVFEMSVFVPVVGVAEVRVEEILVDGDVVLVGAVVVVE